MGDVKQAKSPQGQQKVDLIKAFEARDFEDEDVEEESDQCDSQHLLMKNTDSFTCLAQVVLSNSSLLRQKFFLFPPLQDPGIDEAFNFVGAIKQCNKLKMFSLKL